MTVENAYDVVVAGGAIIGSAIAYFLAAESRGLATKDRDRLRVAVVERDPSYQLCSTGRSLASIRVQFSCPENVAISQFGVEFIKAAPRLLAVDGDAPALSFREDGYLVLADDAGREVLEANHLVQRAAGADVILIEPEDLPKRFPWIDPDGVALGSFGVTGEGWFDAYALMAAFRRKAQALGVTYLHDEVTAIETAGGRVTSVGLAGGDHLATGHLVNASGPNAARVAALAGITLPVHPRKRNVFVIDCKQSLPGFPLLIDTDGTFCRPEGPSFICGWSPPEAEDPDCEDFEIDWDLFEARVWPTLAKRVPAFEAVKLANAWTGHYAVNPLDHNAILGAHPELQNFILANGFSGHGVQQSPAVGRGIAELLVHGAYRSLDLGMFGFQRFAQGRLIHERNVF